MVLLKHAVRQGVSFIEVSFANNIRYFFDFLSLLSGKTPLSNMEPCLQLAFLIKSIILYDTQAVSPKILGTQLSHN